MDHSVAPDLLAKINGAWSAETSADPGWSPTNPALGQCAVTALVVQELMGGELLRAVVDGRSHYWNLLPGSFEVDLTREQFLGFCHAEVEIRERDYVLSFPDTRARFEVLKGRIAELVSVGTTGGASA